MRRQPAAQPAHRAARAAALVLVPGLLVAVLAGVFGFVTASPDHRAIGSVALSEIAGNRPAYELNTFAADFETALASPEVTRAIADAVRDGAIVSDLELSRLDDASLLTLTLTATEQDAARDALLAAGRAAYQQVVQQQRDLQLVRVRASQLRLDELTAEVNRLREAVESAPPEERPARQALVDQRRQAVAIAVQEQSDAEGGLAVAERVAARLRAADGSVVRVGDVQPTSVVPHVVNVMAAGLLAGALVGLLLTFLLHRRPLRSAESSRRRLHLRGLTPEVAARGAGGQSDEVPQPSLTP